MPLENSSFTGLCVTFVFLHPFVYMQMACHMNVVKFESQRMTERGGKEHDRRKIQREHALCRRG